MIIHTLGHVLIVESALLLLPLVVAVIYGESLLPFIITIFAAGLVGFLMLLVKQKTKKIYAAEGFAIVALSWILTSLIGALPFVIGGSAPNYIDALFETVSGFTTTGASIFGDVESLGRGILFWRSLTHWIGGMGVLVFILAIMPQRNARSIHLMRAEIPGPSVDKLVPRARQTALWLYGIYFGMTLAEVVFLLFGGMSVFESFVNAFATAGTGGFSIMNNSITGNSSYIQGVIAVFMLLFGINFNVYFLLLIGDFKQALRGEETRIYLSVIAVSTIVITINIASRFSTVGEAFEKAFFQVSSIITTTGFVTDDFNLWPTLSKVILFLLMTVGACGGSTGGAVKVSRFIIMVKKIVNETVKMVHPKSVRMIRLDGKIVEPETVNSVCLYFVAYILISAVCVLIVSFDGFDFETTLTSVTACIGNIGPGLGAVGATGNYSDFSVLSKLVLSFAMLLGRLEIFPLLILLSPSIYKRQ